MKKAISIFLCTVMVFLLCGGLFTAFTADDIELESAKAVISPNGYDITYVDSDGNEEKSEFTYSKPRRSGLKSVSLPSSYDARSAGVITSVKDQGNTGNCWAYSTCAALEADAVSRGYASVNSADYSESHLAWFTLTPTHDEEGTPYGDYYTVDEESPYDSGGSWMHSSSALAALNGPALDSLFPSSVYDFSQMGNYPEAARINLSGGVIMKGAETITTSDEVKQWIMNHGAVTASIPYYDQFENKNTASYYFSPGDNYATNHMITIIGWDDSYPVSNFKSSDQPSNPGAWLVKNSWGPKRHSSGCFWLSYESGSTQEFCGFSVMEKGDIYKRYSYTGIGTLNMMGTGTQTTFANIYTSTGADKLEAISYFTTYTQNLMVSAKVYTGVTAGNPESGTLAYSTDTSAHNTGYHMITLDNPVNLAQGTKFSIVLTYQSTDGSSPAYMPCERLNRTDEGLNYTVEAGQSFMKIGTWCDNTEGQLASYNLGNNAITAYVSCIEHQYQTTVIAPTCVESGYTQYKCLQCGVVRTGSFTPPSGSHSYGDWVTSDGEGNLFVSTRTCTECGHTQTETYIKGSRLITLRQLIQMIFDRIFAFARRRK